MINMKKGLAVKPLTVKEVDILTAKMCSHGVSVAEYARLVQRTPAECSLIIGRKKALDKYDRELLLGVLK